MQMYAFVMNSFPTWGQGGISPTRHVKPEYAPVVARVRSGLRAAGVWSEEWPHWWNGKGLPTSLTFRCRWNVQMERKHKQTELSVAAVANDRLCMIAVVSKESTLQNEKHLFRRIYAVGSFEINVTVVINSETLEPWHARVWVCLKNVLTPFGWWFWPKCCAER